MRAGPVSIRLLHPEGIRWATLLLCLAMWPMATASAGDRSLGSPRRTPVVEAVRKVQPCVVNITSEKKAASTSRWPFSQEENQRPRVSGMGTGVLIDPRGYILTNQHVVDKVQGVEVHLSDGTSLPARVIQQDEAMDVAVLKVEAGRLLPSIVIGTSADLELGEPVITIGNAFGYENTVSQGIISQLNRNVTLSDEQVYRNLIQTDACINPGNSGGPLVNIEGELIGINVAVRAGAQGIGFALPIDDVKRVATELMSTRRIAGTWHGVVAGETLSGSNRAIVVADITTGSPAEVAGIKKGDQVLRVGDYPVTTTLDIERALIDSKVGAKNEILVRRGGEEKTLNLELQPVPRAGGAAGDTIWRTLGVRTVPVNREYVKNVVPDRNGGLYVQTVQPGSPAARALIQKGDVLIGMSYGQGGWETTQLDNILYVLRRPEAGQSVPLQCWVVRKNELLQRVMPIAEAPAVNARR